MLRRVMYTLDFFHPFILGIKSSINEYNRHIRKKNFAVSLIRFHAGYFMDERNERTFVI